jgi:putative Mn2+ efflux pump MntP
MKYFNSGDALKMAFFFGAFQLVMPVIGWLSGLTLRNFITGVDHWVAFGLLLLIGCKMIYESFKIDKEKPECKYDGFAGIGACHQHRCSGGRFKSCISV